MARMNRSKRIAIITKLIKEMIEAGCLHSEWYVQKACYFLQEAMRVPLGYEFFCHHGSPYSFELRDEITGMRADGLIRLKPNRAYTPSVCVTSNVERLHDDFTHTLKRYGEYIGFTVDVFAGRTFNEIEDISIALWAAGGEIKNNKSLRYLIKKLPYMDIGTAVNEIDRILSQCNERERQMFDVHENVDEHPFLRDVRSAHPEIALRSGAVRDALKRGVNFPDRLHDLIMAHDEMAKQISFLIKEIAENG